MQLRLKQYKMISIKAIFLLLILLTFLPNPAFSALQEVGPVGDNGFPLWYSDTNGVVLKPCLDMADGLCLIEPTDLPFPDLPISWPTNFPDEIFWWTGETALEFTPVGGDMKKGGTAKFVLALEGAFANDKIVPGNQVAFTRIRIRITGLIPGETYTMTHPYGVTVEEADFTGRINTTEDIGVTSGNFSGALTGKVGPFLVWTDTASPPPAGYIGNPNVSHKVTGSPFNTNFFKIEGPGLDSSGLMTDRFSILGKRVGGALSNVVITDTAFQTHDKKVPFGIVPTNTVPPEQTLTISNASQGEFKVKEIDQENLIGTPFSIVDACSDKKIVPPGEASGPDKAESCSLQILFTPIALGNFTGSFDLHLHNSDEFADIENLIVSIELNGTGGEADITVIDPLNPIQGNLVQMPFGKVTIQTSSDKEVWIKNNGLVDLHVIAKTQDDPNSAFSLLKNPDTCSANMGTVTPGGKCSFKIRYSPLSVNETQSEKFTILSDSPGEERVYFDVSGKGGALPAPVISVIDHVNPLQDKQISYGDVITGSIKQELVTVRNDGNATLNITNIFDKYPVSPHSISEDSCSGTSLPVTEECTFVVQFLPTDTKFFTESLEIYSDDPDESTVILNLSGTGIPVPMPDMRITDSNDPISDHNISFGRLTAGITKTEIITLSNDGIDDLEIGLIGTVNPIDAPFNISRDTCSHQTIAPANHCTFEVSFSAKADSLGNANEAFDIPSNDPDASTVIFTVDGETLRLGNNNPDVSQLVFPADGQIGTGGDVNFGFNVANDPDGDPLSYIIVVCENESMIDCTPEAIEIPALLAPKLAKAGKSMSFAGLVIGAGMLAGFVLIGSSKSRKKIGMFMAAFIFSGTLMISCTHGGSGRSAGLSANAPDITAGILGLESGKTYYWKVIARDEFGGESESDVRHFTT